MVLKVTKLHVLTMSAFSCLCELKFIFFVHAKALKALKKRKNSPSFLQVLDPYQDQDEESAVVVVEESEKEKKSAQDTVIDVALLVPHNVQTSSM